MTALTGRHPSISVEVSRMVMVRVSPDVLSRHRVAMTSRVGVVAGPDRPVESDTGIPPSHATHQLGIWKTLED